MGLEKARYSFKNEEMPTVGMFLRNAYVRDHAEVAVDNPDYDAEYLTEYDGKLEAVVNLIYPKGFTDKIKKATEDLAKDMISLRPALDKLEGYVVRATGLTVNAKDFGISQVRQKITSDDQEGLDMALKILIDNLSETENKAALSAKGMKDELADSFATLKEKIKEGNAAQNKLVSDRNTKVAENIGLINILWDAMQDIAKGFKAFYKSKNSVKVDDYTWAKYKRKIRSANKGKREEPPLAAAA